MTKAVFLIILYWLQSIAYAESTEQTPVPRFVLGIYLPGVNDEINTTDIRLTMDYWLKEVSRDLNIFDSHTEFFIDMNKMRESFDKNDLDMIIAPPLPIVKNLDLSELADGFVGVRAHGQMSSLILLVKNDPSIESLENLRGKKLFLMKNDDLCELFIDTEVRKHFHVGYKQYFGNVEQKQKSDRIILDLFFGKADAVLVYLSAYDVMTELNPQVKANTKILLTYPLRAKNYSFFSKHFAYAKIILKKINAFAKNPRGKQILELFRTDEIEEAKVEGLEPISRLYKDNINLIKNAK